MGKYKTDHCTQMKTEKKRETERQRESRFNTE